MENLNLKLKNYFKTNNIKIGALIKGKVVEILKDMVMVDVGLKSEAIISRSQFKDINGKEQYLKIGNLVNVVIISLENGVGKTILSRELARKYEAWYNLNEAFLQNKIIKAIMVNKVKGGYTLLIDHIIKAFLPGSLVHFFTSKDRVNINEGQILEVKLIKFNIEKNNIIVSRKAVVESQYLEEKQKILNKLQPGLMITGLVKNITDYGVFLDLGGIDGLLHITDMSWARIKHPSDLVTLGSQLQVQIIKIENNRISLGLKQLTSDPWQQIKTKYIENKLYYGKVINITEYGCFIELAPGIEGLLHVTEMDWVNKNINPHQLVKLNHKIKVMLLNLDINKRRISLGLKQCLPNPWKQFITYYKLRNLVTGTIKAITDFGIFLSFLIAPNIAVDGLIHIYEINGKHKINNILKNYHIGDIISARLLSVDIERERILLGLKQLEKTPFFNFLTKLNFNILVSLKYINNKNIKHFNKYKLTVIINSNLEGIIINIKDKLTFYQKNINKLILVKIVGYSKKHNKVYCYYN